MTKYQFKLYVIKDNAKSMEAAEQIKVLFDQALKDEYALEIIDILENPNLAAQNKIMASPTLVMELPAPVQKLVGNLSDTSNLLLKLNLFDNKG